MNGAYGPKQADHPTIGEPCPACHEPFREGDWTLLVPIGPGDDPDAQKKAREGRAYTAVAIEVHYTCVTGDLYP